MKQDPKGENVSTAPKGDPKPEQGQESQDHVLSKQASGISPQTEGREVPKKPNPSPTPALLGALGRTLGWGLVRGSHPKLKVSRF